MPIFTRATVKDLVYINQVFICMDQKLTQEQGILQYGRNDWAAFKSTGETSLTGLTSWKMKHLNHILSFQTARIKWKTDWKGDGL